MIARLLIACLCCLMWAGDGACWEVVTSGGEDETGTIILDDVFLEAAATTLSSHTPSPGPGGAWTNLAADATILNIITETGAAPSTNSIATSAVSQTTAMTSGTVSINGRTMYAAATRNISACLFASGSFSVTSDIDGYCAYINGTGLLVVWEVNNDVPTTIATGSTCTGYSVSKNYDIILTASPDNYYSAKLMDGDTEVCATAPVQNTTYQNGKYPGIRATHTAVRIISIIAESND